MLTRTATSPLSRPVRPVAVVLISSLLSPVLLVGCGSNQAEAPPPPRDASPNEMSRVNPNAAPTKSGMTTKQKVILLVGAAALYYLYKKHKAKVDAGQTNVQYYLSKNGRIYYRDPQTHQAIWVTPPKEPIRINESEASDYEGLQGYNNSPTGKDLTGLVPAG